MKCEGHRNDPLLKLNLYSNHGQMYIPFRLRSGVECGEYCSIGGSPPVGVMPGRIEANTRYLATVGLEGDVDVSIFTTFDYGATTSPFNFFRGTYKLYDQSQALVQFVVHPRRSLRDSSSMLKSEIPTLGFVFGKSGVDPECSIVEALGSSAIYTDHKVGGQPFFNQLEGDVGASLELLREGYVHLFQIAFPSRQDTLIDVDWPFGEAIFHVFAKKSGQVFEFRYIWG